MPNDEGRLDDEVGEASEVLEDEEDDDAAGVDHGQRRQTSTSRMRMSR